MAGEPVLVELLAVVGGDDEDGVSGDAGALQRFPEPTDLLVAVGDGRVVQPAGDFEDLPGVVVAHGVDRAPLCGRTPLAGVPRQARSLLFLPKMKYN